MRRVLGIGGIGAAVVLATAAHGQTPRTVRLTRIADTSTPVPGGAGTFALFGDARDLDGRSVVFYGSDAASNAGFYSWRGGTLGVVADESTLVPGTATPFGVFFDVQLESGLVAFTGGWGAGPSPCFAAEEGLFLAPFDGSSVASVADSLTSGVSCFHGVGWGDGRMLVTGGNAGVDVFHNHMPAILEVRVPGVPVVRVDDTTPRPSGGTFFGFDQELSIRGTTWAFAEAISNTLGANAGAYRYAGGVPQLVVDSTTPIPGGTGNFMSIAGMDFDGDRVAFVGRNASNATAVYAGTSPGDLVELAGRTTRVPGTGVNFLGVSNFIGFDRGLVAFSGYWAGGGYGLFVARDGRVQKVVAKGDVLDGRTVEQAFCGPGHVDGNVLLVRVIFQGFTASGLYLAEIHPPRRAD